MNTLSLQLSSIVKIQMSGKDHCGYVYLLIEREFINANQPIYKIGRTGQNPPWHRLNGYPKGSQFIFFLSVNNHKKIEQNIKKELKNTHSIQHRKNIGQEYFEGHIDQFLPIFNRHCSTQINEFTNQPKKLINTDSIKTTQMSVNVTHDICSVQTLREAQLDSSHRPIEPLKRTTEPLKRKTELLNRTTEPLNRTRVSTTPQNQVEVDIINQDINHSTETSRISSNIIGGTSLVPQLDVSQKPEAVGHRPSEPLQTTRLSEGYMTQEHPVQHVKIGRKKNSKKFFCQYCKSGFTRKDNLDRHLTKDCKLIRASVQQGALQEIAERVMILEKNLKEKSILIKGTNVITIDQRGPPF